MPTLTFEPETHTYAVNGRRVPSVTEIIKANGLIEERFLDEAAMKRGSYVHEALQFDDEGQLDMEALDPRLKGYVWAWRAFKQQMAPTVLEIEKQVYHPVYRYAGTYDRLLLIKNARWIVDIKTGSPATWHPIQTALYAMPFDFEREKVRPLRASVYLSDDSKFRWSPHESGLDFDVAKAAITMALFKKGA